jgi:hypothetical protein
VTPKEVTTAAASSVTATVGGEMPKIFEKQIVAK